MPEARITAHSASLSDLMAGSLFKVPEHQRNYDWDPKNVVELLEDVENAMVSKVKEYFLGTVMLVPMKKMKGGGRKPVDSWYVNDGQQRLVTTTLIFARLAHKMGRGRSKETVALRSRLYNLCFHDFQETDLPDPDELLPFELAPRITAPSEDISTFGKLLRKMDLAGDTKLVRAWQKIDEWLCAPERDNNRWRERYARHILDSVSMVRLEVPESFDLHAIFETLNSRGKSLEEIDLLKNYCLHRATRCNKETRKLVKFSFDVMEGELKRKNRMSDYVRCHMQAKFGYLPENNLFRNIRGAINKGLGKSGNCKKFSELVSELGSDYIRMYEMYRRPDNFSEEIVNLVGEVRGVGRRDLLTCLREVSRYTVVFPVVHSLFVSFLDSHVITPKEFVKVCQALSAFMVRVSLAQGAVRPSLYEKELAELATKLYKNPSTALTDVQAAIKILDSKGSHPSVMDDGVFVEGLATLSPKSVPKSKMLLSAMEVVNETGSSGQFSDSTVYAILPTNPGIWDRWEGFDGQQATWCHRIGNKVLVENDLASQLANVDQAAAANGERAFNRIKDVLSTSSYGFTRGIVDFPAWNKLSVSQRQAEAAKRAASFWRMS